MRLRCFAFVLALLIAVTPALGVVCVMDCEQVPATSTCHESANAPDASIMRGVHACIHDHSPGGPALLASGHARDSVSTPIALPLTRVMAEAVVQAGAAARSMHGPPGSSDRRPSFFSIAILRI